MLLLLLLRAKSMYAIDWFVNKIVIPMATQYCTLVITF